MRRVCCRVASGVGALGSARQAPCGRRSFARSPEHRLGRLAGRREPPIGSAAQLGPARDAARRRRGETRDARRETRHAARATWRRLGSGSPACNRFAGRAPACRPPDVTPNCRAAAEPVSLTTGPSHLSATRGRAPTGRPANGLPATSRSGRHLRRHWRPPAAWRARSAAHFHEFTWRAPPGRP